jgi:ribosomal 50S subunit-associated protein YjgA (DUF615 family)
VENLAGRSVREICVMIRDRRSELVFFEAAVATLERMTQAARPSLHALEAARRGLVSGDCNCSACIMAAEIIRLAGGKASRAQP